MKAEGISHRCSFTVVVVIYLTCEAFNKSAICDEWHSLFRIFAETIAQNVRQVPNCVVINNQVVQCDSRVLGG